MPICHRRLFEKVFKKNGEGLEGNFVGRTRRTKLADSARQYKFEILRAVVLIIRRDGRKKRYVQMGPLATRFI